MKPLTRPHLAALEIFRAAVTRRPAATRPAPSKTSHLCHNGLLALLLISNSFERPASLLADDYDQRARQLVARMTLDEKISELHGIQDATHYRFVPPNSRLGIPALHMANSPAGIGPAGDDPQKPATALPAPILLASSWDVDLARRYGVIIGREAKMLGEDLLEGPDINIARVPQNGRTFEAFGEDPYLTAQMSVNEIRGIQSEDEIANVKHYAANNQEANRFKVNEIISERALREIYLPAFEASVKEGRVASLMSAYPLVNGSYCSENNLLLNQILKDEWHFQGFITSDFGAVHSTIPTALAGLDLEMPTGIYFSNDLRAAISSNQLPASVIDEKLVRRFRTMMQFGFFDGPPDLKPIPARKHGNEARQIAEEGMVLLKNTGQLLPLIPEKLHRIAVIGPFAAKAMTGGGGSSHVIPLYTVDPMPGIQTHVARGTRIDFADGDNLAEAVRYAKYSDVAVVMAGSEETEGEDHSLVLTNNQNALISAVAAANPRTIVVLKTGSPALMPWVDQVPAILEAWYPGEEDGNAVAAALFGEVNPSGKLPLTFPRRLEDLPAHTPEQYPGVNGTATYSEEVFVGYRHFDAHDLQPLFPFGFGISYTTFDYSHLTVVSSNLSSQFPSNGTVTIHFDVTNVGKREGKEVAELYLGLPATPALPQPPKQLKAFAKVPLKPGHTGHVQLELGARSFSCWDTSRHAWTILPGTYRIMVGASSRDIRLQENLTLGADVATRGVQARPGNGVNSRGGNPPE